MSQKENKNILIIGGTGFIGYHLIKRLLKIGWKPYSISRYKPVKEKLLKKVDYLNLNINNLKSIKNKLKKNYRYIINLSGVTSKNKKGIINITNYLAKRKIKKFIHIGSSAEYGNQKSLPHTENLKCEPVSQYGKQNLKNTNYLIDSYKKNKLPVIILRLFQVYGNKDNNNKIIPFILKNCLKNKRFNLTKGLQTRDFCHIDDLVDSIILILRVKNKRLNGNIFNIASGRSIKIKNLVNMIKLKVKGGRPNFGAKKIKKSEIIHSRASIKKIKKYINWSPKITLNKGINLLINNEK